MKILWRRVAALGLICCLLATAASAAQTQKHGLELADSLKLTSQYTQNENGIIREQVLTYEPGGDVRPVVVYGDTIYGRSTMDYIQEYLTKQDDTPVAAVNAAFFDMSTGVPYGMVVTDGILRTSGDTKTTVGVLEDGSVIIGWPGLAVELGWKDQRITLNYNKALTRQSGYCLYSRDYDTRTKNTISAYNLILEADRDELRVSDQLQAVVRDIVPDTASCAIPEGCFVLSLAVETNYATAMEQMKKIAVGDQVTIFSQVNRGWENVEYAVSGGDLLVEDGLALSDFTLNTADKQAARTALGVREDGKVVCYTVDIGSNSRGMTLKQLAERMKELGCIGAVNLDGGGSTTLGATPPGYEDFFTVNKPSEGKQRPCANFLFFVRPTTEPKQAQRLHLYPYNAVVLPGGKVDLTVKATDENYMAVAVPGPVSYRAEGGSIGGDAFVAEKVGTAKVTAYAGGLSGFAEILVVETPSEMTVRRADQKKALKELLLETGGQVDLTAQATYLGMALSAQDSSFTWFVPTELGQISADGVFTAADAAGKGDLTVSCGEETVTIPVQLRENPFVDTADHWARPYIAQMNFRDVLQGSADSQGQMKYRPDDSMTRQEFVVAMARSRNVDLSKYEDVELPFDDAEQIADWAEAAMKAAYELGWFTGSGKGEKLYAYPTQTVTREAAMTMLARTISASSDSDALDVFSDVSRVSDWARSALTAMVEQGIINGMDGKLVPQGNVTRAQVAKMLYAMEQ